MTMNFKILWTLQKFLISLNSMLTNSYNTWLTHFMYMSFYLPVAKFPQKQCDLNGRKSSFPVLKYHVSEGDIWMGPSSFYLSFSLCLLHGEAGGSHVWGELAQWGHSWAFLRSKCTMDGHCAPGLRLEVTHEVHASRDFISQRQSKIDTSPRYMAMQSRVYWRARKNGADGAINVCCTRNRQPRMGNGQ